MMGWSIGCLCLFLVSCTGREAHAPLGTSLSLYSEILVKQFTSTVLSAAMNQDLTRAEEGCISSQQSGVTFGTPEKGNFEKSL